jgi:hypothetical protein
VVQNSITEVATSRMPGKGGQVVEVRTFDAVSDGMTNVTPTFNAALASLATAAARACLVPRGTYLISGFSARGQTPISPERVDSIKKDTEVKKFLGVARV